MRSFCKWLLTLALLALLAGALVWSYRAHHESADQEEPAEAGEAGKLKEGAEEHTHVKLTAEAQARLGLQVAAPQAAELPREAAAFGQVIDPSALVALDAEVVIAEAALETGRATVERERGLFGQQQNISRKVLEASEAQFRADETRARTARRRLLLEWGEGVAQLAPTARATLVEALASGAEAVVRVDVPAGEALAELPSSAAVMLLGHEDQPIPADSVAAAATVDPKTQAQGFLVLVSRAPQALRPGAAVLARLALPGEKEKGVLLPRAAIVRHEGEGWAFVKTGPEKFERRSASLEHVAAGGYLQTENFAATEEVVIVGAQALLSEELKALLEAD